jgi:glycine reductase
MIKELEDVVDVPCVHICTVVPISLTVGANRIAPAVAIPHPLGNPALSREDEFRLRREIVEKALKALCTDVTEQTVF